MRKRLVLAVGAVALAALNPAPAWAQATTTFVSGDGLDTNPCTVAAPCRSFQRAHNQTAAGGQITMLDPAGYGAVTITKAISIVNDGGGEAGVNDPTANQDAITINAGASDVVNLRGLTLNGVGTGRFGINLVNGGTLNVQNCVIRAFVSFGMRVSPPPSTVLAVRISDTILANSEFGISMTPAASVVMTASLERVALIDNGVFGMFIGSDLTGTVQGTIVDSVAIGNGSVAFDLDPGMTGAISLINSQVINNGKGLQLEGGSMYLSRMTLAGNAAGFDVVNGTLKTFGDNYIIDTNNSGTLTPITEQ